MKKIGNRLSADMEIEQANMKPVLLSIFIVIQCISFTYAQEKPLFSFGVVSDVQYTDAETIGNRNFESYQKPLALFGESKNKVLYVIGNHEYEIDDKDKPKVNKLLGLNKKGYNYFDKDSWRFVILNGMGLSIKSSMEGTKKRALAVEKFQELKEQGAVNAYDWNGAIDKKQLKWLDKILADATKKELNVILFCHLTQQGSKKNLLQSSQIQTDSLS